MAWNELKDSLLKKGIEINKKHGKIQKFSNKSSKILNFRLLSFARDKIYLQYCYEFLDNYLKLTRLIRRSMGKNSLGSRFFAGIN
ncbi:hypothetical protein BpHYR1_000408 [Brachionus plicatilis]|uniref:Uncharacterized protein n=1 Tax=Brachionus plicatilis TaxID=10195 RepID=A0A3M7QPB4_BRAPC|nr:hypothetical protein BpHYR1_000408 [Brachionus plicatilis]